MKQTLSVILPMNEYLELIHGTPFPKANDKVSQNMSTAGFANVMDYGAKGDGKTNDDSAIKKAFLSGKSGILFPDGHTFLVSSMINVTLQHDIAIYAYGATIKKADLSGYGWLQMRGKAGVKAIFAGGTIDGNQQYQQWKGNPTGGRYDGAMLGHNCLLAGVGFDFCYAKDINFKNITCDGVRGEDNFLSVVSNCNFVDSATFHYNPVVGSNGKSDPGAGDQGSASKFRVTKGNCHFYLLDSNFSKGSIGHQSSFPENKKSGNTIPDDIVTFINNCKFEGFTQDTIHIEDSRKAIFYKVVADCYDDGKFKQPRIWISNSTEIFYSQDSIYNNTVINFVNRASMKLAIINGGVISSNMNYSKTAVRGNLDIIANAEVKGTHVQALNSVNCKVENGSIDNDSNRDEEMLKSTIDIIDSSNNNKLGTLSITDNVVPNPDPNPTPTPAPGAFSAKVGIEITRTDSSDAKNYDLLRCETENGIFNAIATNVGDRYVDDTVEAAKSYYYQFKATNETGEALSNIIIVGNNSAAIPDSNPEPDPEPTPDDETTNKLIVGMLPFQHADALGLPIGRNRIKVGDEGGIWQMIRYNGKIKFAPSVVYEGKTFPTDISSYKSKLTDIARKLNKNIVPFFALENEPNYNEKNGGFSVYIQMVRAALDVFKDTGIDIFIGGITFNVLAAICSTLYDRNSSEWAVFKSVGLTAANKDSIVFINEYLQAVVNEDLPIHFCFHVNISEQTLPVLPLVLAKLQQLANGRKIICGECSFSKQNADWVTQALTIMKDLHAVILYSEEKPGGGYGAAVKINSEMDNAVKAFINS